MKISKLFHWLYATLMFLPLFVAPIFAIYVRNENSTFAQEIEVPQYEVVTFNQLVPNPEPVSLDSYSIAGESNKGSIEMNGTYIRYTALERTNQAYNQGFGQHGMFTLESNHIYYSKVSIHVSASMTITVAGTAGGGRSFSLGANEYYTAEYTFTRNDYSTNQNRYFFMSLFNDLGSYFEIQYNQLFDLTLMFGYGNEPTIEQFKLWYPAVVYDYNAGTKQLLNIGAVTYNETDVGSQFIYSLYHTTDKYLNFDSVLNLYQLDEWIKLNVFNANAPLFWTIAWHYLEYWLILSIYWLCFDVIMYVPLLAHRWLDKASLE